MKTAEKKLKRFTKRNEFLMLVFSASFSFTLLFFSSVMAYMENPAAYMTDFRHIALPMLGMAAAVTLLLFGISNLAMLISRRAYVVFSRLLTGLLLAFTVQEFFMNGRMNVVKSDDVRYGRYKAMIIVNAVIFTAVMLLPLILKIWAHFAPASRAARIAGDTAAAAAALFLLAVNMTATSAKTLTTDYKQYNGIQQKYLSYGPALSLSDEGNVVVFLTDRLDSLWMDELLEKYPELNDEFSGFTFYQNNISSGTSTFPTVPEFLTMDEYDGEEWAEYLSDAWDGDTLPQRLKDGGYNVYLLPDRITTLSSVAQIEGQCDNIEEYSYKVKHDVFGVRGVWLTMSRMALARVLPYTLRHVTTYWMGADFCRFMFTNDDCGEDFLLPQAQYFHDLRFSKYLDTHSITADSSNRTFSFIHLNCCHTIVDDVAELYGLDGENDVYKTTRGDFEILFKYFRQMKEAGVFDNSTIIVMGDHGRAPRELKGSQSSLDNAITTALLIKPAGAEDVPLEKDRYSELSINYFAASILEYAGLDRSGCGYSYNDIINGDLHIPRFIRGFDFAGYGRMVYQDGYEVTGDARDFNNWKNTG